MIKKFKLNKRIIIGIISTFALVGAAGSLTNRNSSNVARETSVTQNIQTEVFAEEFSLSNIAGYNGRPYVIINDNKPYFSESDKTTTAYESYGELDDLGRCSVCIACIDKSLMPTESRGEIGSIKPTGWHTIKYDCIEDNYLYNRCHLIGWQLTGENANEKNLITGTRYMNVSGMLLFENVVADYVKETDNHVLYRVTPVFEGNNLVASGVLIEALSIEDNGEGIEFCVYCYNVQPGVSIDYSNGESTQDEYYTKAVVDSSLNTYVLNTSTKKFHKPDCTGLPTKNRSDVTDTRDNIISQGYEPCKICSP